MKKPKKTATKKLNHSKKKTVRKKTGTLLEAIEALPEHLIFPER